MALTFEQMTQQILAETFRDSSFYSAVQNAIISAIKELETQQLFINEKGTTLSLPNGTNTVALPSDFMSVIMLILLENNGNTAYTEASGFKEVSFYQLQTFSYQYNYYVPVTPGNWALYGNQIYVYPVPANDYTLQLYYWYRDPYPVNPSDTSIWLGDFTQDATRYKARSIFYKDVLQSPELAQADEAKAQQAISQLKIRAGQRETINTLSF